MTPIRILAAAALLALALPAAADEPRCAFQRPVDQALDVNGVRTVVFRIDAHDVSVRGGSGPARISGQACASSQALLDGLQVTQQRSGDTLTVRIGNQLQGLRLFKSGTERLLKLTASVPASTRVQVITGSGDARVAGVREASVDLGSGDVEVTDVAGTVFAKVGSGDLSLQRIGGLHLLGLGSGDMQARDVRGAVRVDAVGSGDVTLTAVGGPVQVQRVGSGDVEIRDVQGDVRIGALGAGDVEVRNVRGNLQVQRVGSGDVRHQGVTGTVQVPSRR